MVSTMTNEDKVKLPEGYKQTEVGMIPEDWSVSTVHNVSLVPMQNGLFYEPQRKGEGVPIINVGDMYASAPIDVSSLDLFDATNSEIKVFKVQKGDLFFTRSSIVPSGIAYCNTFKEENTVAVFDSHLIRVRPDPKVMDADFLYLNCIASHSRRFLISSAKTATMTTIDQGAIKKCPVLVPPLKEQTAIADALSDVDNLIASLESLIAKKSAIKTAAMQQLLTGKKRFPAFAKKGAKQSSELDNTSETAQAAETKQVSTLNSDLHKESGEGVDAKSNQESEVGNANNKQTAPRPGYKQSELGEIPEDWEVKALGCIGETIIGLTYSPNDVASFGSLVLRSSNVQKNRLAFKNNVFVDMDLPDRVIVRQDDILVCVRNGSRQLIGKCALIDEKTAGSAFGAFMSIYRTEFSKFVFFQFQSNIIQNQINEVMGATINQITNKDMASFKIPVPKNKDEQTAIAGVLFDIDAELDGLQQRLSKTQKIKQGMMQELLTGKTRLIKGVKQ